MILKMINFDDYDYNDEEPEVWLRIRGQRYCAIPLTC